MSDRPPPPAKRAWQQPAVRSYALPGPTLLLACSANHPVQCPPHNIVGCAKKAPCCADPFGPGC